MKFKETYNIFVRITKYLKSPSLLFARLVIAYGFLGPAMMKWGDIDATAQWFASMNFPLPLLNAYAAATTEIVGVVLLTLGLFTRFISIPLIIIMIVAIATVHLPNGFSAGDNGFEIPLYYMIFLLIFLSHGAGRFSLDHFILGENDK